MYVHCKEVGILNTLWTFKIVAMFQSLRLKLRNITKKVASECYFYEILCILHVHHKFQKFYCSD